VDPNLKGVKITFDRPMLDGAWSVVGGGPHFPQVDGSVSYDTARKIFTIPVKLKANWSYEFWLNSDQYKSFQSQDRIPLEPVHVTFSTGDKR
jgi:hypothetical protein